MKKKIKRLIVLVLAAVFMIFGLIGLVLPFLQGILFITISILLLSMLSPSLREKLERQTRKWPKFHVWVLKAQKFIERFIGEV